MAAGTKITQICLGVIGTVGSNLGLFFIPTPFYSLFWFSRTVGDHSPIQHLASLLSSMFWVVYGLPFVQSDTLVTTSNALSCFIAMVYLILFAIYSKSRENRRKVIGLLILEIIVVSVTAAVVLSVIHDIKLRSHIFGTIAAICQFGTFVAPLVTMKLAIAARDENHINLILAGVSFEACGVWLMYALVSSNVYIAVPNIAVLVLRAVECLVYFYIQDCPRENKECHMDLP